MRRLAAVAVVAMLTIAGCGGDDGDLADTSDVADTTVDTGASPTSTPETAAAGLIVRGRALPEFEAGQDGAVGMQAPEVEGDSFEGSRVEILPDGTPKGIVFLAHWCPHCQAEVPRVQAWVEQGGVPEGVELVSVSTFADSSMPNYPPSEWLEREGWTLPVLVDDDDGTVAQAFGLTGFPFWVFVDGDGVVVARHFGEMSTDALADMLAGLS